LTAVEGSELKGDRPLFFGYICPENRFRVQRFRGSRLGNSCRLASETNYLKPFSSPGATGPCHDHLQEKGRVRTAGTGKTFRNNYQIKYVEGKGPIMLTERDNKILCQFASLVRKRFSDARIWAFGSRTSGKSTDESDLDVCVVLDRLDDGIDRAVMDIAWHVGFENDVVVSTVTYSRDEFEQGPCSESPLVKNVMHAGVMA
jgi:hypothetical protein